MDYKQELRTLFENDYPGIDELREKLIKPIWHNVSLPNKSIEINEEDRVKIYSITIFANQETDINFVDVEVGNSLMLKRNRVTINKYIAKNIVDNFQSALIFFHYKDDAKEWRISYVYKEESETKITNPKRYTYLCGKDYHCRTAAERFAKLIENEGYPSSSQMLSAFSIEPLSKEFFERYREYYADFVEYISGTRYVKENNKFVPKKTGKANPEFKSQFDNDEKAVRDYIKKLMGRLVFLHFMQKKGWLGVKQDQEWGTGDKDFIFNLFQRADDETKNNFLEKVLEPLFFMSLNTDRGEEALAPDIICNVYKEKVRIPFLNGGLFEQDEIDKKQVKFKKDDFKKLLTFFNEYNFTIDEADPYDQEIGVDPEMLGKIFENQLEDNKDKGAFYTPKEIVQYMCRESLITYLTNKTEIPKDKITNFVTNHNPAIFSDVQRQKVNQNLQDI